MSTDNWILDTIKAKSDQLNADDLIAGPITVTVTKVSKGQADQPCVIAIDGGHQPFKPCKTVRRVLVACWGADSAAWVGRKMLLVRDPSVQWAGQEVGGIRVEALSHIDADKKLSLAVTRGKKAAYTIYRLGTETAPEPTLVDKWRPKLSKLSAAAKKVANTIREGWLLADAEKLQSAETMLADLGVDEAEIVGEYLRESLEEIST